MRVTSRHLLPHLGLFRYDKLFVIHWHCIPLWQLRIYLLWLDFMDVCFFCNMLFFLKSRSICKKWLLIFVAIIKYYFGCYMFLKERSQHSSGLFVANLLSYVQKFRNGLSTSLKSDALRLLKIISCLIIKMVINIESKFVFSIIDRFMFGFWFLVW